MTLLESIRKKRIATATVATLATHADQSKKIASTVATVASVTVAKSKSEKTKEIEIELVRAWLHKIGENKADRHLVLDKCRKDLEAMEYFLSQANSTVATVASVAVATPEDKKVVAMLDEKPEIKRAIITDTNNETDNVILTMAIRDQYTFQMKISKNKYDAFKIIELLNSGDIH